MKPYQEEYLELLHGAADAKPQADPGDQEAFTAAIRAANQAAEQSVRRGTQLLREHLFPVLDNILTAPPEEIVSLQAFADALMAGSKQTDPALAYETHRALMNYARRKGDRDMLIRELYSLGMALYRLESNLQPLPIRLFRARTRMYFAECASYYDTEYDSITDPEIRGYIHRSMGNIALTYEGSDTETAEAKLALIDRSIRVLSDPDVQAKTPSLPWDLYLYKSHQERTTLLSYLRSGHAGPDAFAQVLESAQIVQNRQLKAMRERGVPLEPRWQYSYNAAKYHCGAMLLQEFLEHLYALSTMCPDTDFSSNSVFCHISAPALYSRYSLDLTDPRQKQHAVQTLSLMTRRMCVWINRVPQQMNNDQVMFYIRQFLYAYEEHPGNMSFYDLIQYVLAARQPALYIRGYLTGQLARQLADWAIEDCPEQLMSFPGCGKVEDVIWRRGEILEHAEKSGHLCDTGILQFLAMESLSSRGLLEEEEALLQLHPVCGSHLLAHCPSTAPFADAARGHHCWYNGKGGYPLDFRVKDSPYRSMISLVAAADTLADVTEEAASRYRPVISFQEAVDTILRGEGTRYAPFVSALVKSEARQAQLQEDLPRWTQDAYASLYRRRAAALAL